MVDSVDCGKVCAGLYHFSMKWNLLNFRRSPFAPLVVATEELLQTSHGQENTEVVIEKLIEVWYPHFDDYCARDERGYYLRAGGHLHNSIRKILHESHFSGA